MQRKWQALLPEYKKMIGSKNWSDFPFKINFKLVTPSNPRPIELEEAYPLKEWILDASTIYLFEILINYCIEEVSTLIQQQKYVPNLVLEESGDKDKSMNQLLKFLENVFNELERLFIEIVESQRPLKDGKVIENRNGTATARDRRAVRESELHKLSLKLRIVLDYTSGMAPLRQTSFLLEELAHMLMDRWIDQHINNMSYYSLRDKKWWHRWIMPGVAVLAERMYHVNPEWTRTGQADTAFIDAMNFWWKDFTSRVAIA